MHKTIFTMLTDRAKEIVNAADSKMKDSLNFLEEDLKGYRLGKASPSIFNGVMVNYYGTMTPLAQVSSIAAPDAKTLTVQPWERNLIPVIEKAILDANIGLTPSNNGEIIRCTVPVLTEERRKDLVKKAKGEGENTKVVIRNSRRDAIEALKKAQKAGTISEDAQHEAEDEIQKLTDKKVKDVDTLVAAKEKDILTV